MYVQIGMRAIHIGGQAVQAINNGAQRVAHQLGLWGDKAINSTANHVLAGKDPAVLGRVMPNYTGELGGILDNVIQTAKATPEQLGTLEQLTEWKDSLDLSAPRIPQFVEISIGGKPHEVNITSQESIDKAITLIENDIKNNSTEPEFDVQIPRPDEPVPPDQYSGPGPDNPLPPLDGTTLGSSVTVGPECANSITAFLNAAAHGGVETETAPAPEAQPGPRVEQSADTDVTALTMKSMGM